MGSFSIWHWLIVLAVAVVLFGGGGKLSRLMGDFGRGLREFKSSLEGETKTKKRGLGGDGTGSSGTGSSGTGSSGTGGRGTKGASKSTSKSASKTRSGGKKT